MDHLASTGIHLLGTRLAAIRVLIEKMPPAVVGQALSYTPSGIRPPRIPYEHAHFRGAAPDAPDSSLDGDHPAEGGPARDQRP